QGHLRSKPPPPGQDSSRRPCRRARPDARCRALHIRASSSSESVSVSLPEGMLDLQQLLRVRSAYAGRFDAGGKHLAFISDLSGVPQVWGIGQRAWPELLIAPPDRAQTLYVGPRPGQLAVGADVG